MKKKIGTISIVGIFLLTSINALTVTSKNIVKINADEITNDNEPPVSDPGGPYILKGDEIVTLDGSKSYDPDGYIIEWQWHFQVRPNKPVTIGYGEKIDFDPDSYPNTNLLWPINEINIILMVTDNDGAFTYGSTDLIFIKNRIKIAGSFLFLNRIFQGLLSI
jgi:hypothetical protein